MRCPSKLGLAAVLGILVGAGISCRGGMSGEGMPGVCLRDSDCVLDCSTTGCCGPDCPCDSARSNRQAARIAEQRHERCSDMKMECPPPRADACDWNSRYRAVCSAGACVAEPIEGGAAPEFRAPEMPSRITAEDPRCRACERSRQDECLTYVAWRCEEEQDCRMAPECDPACCEEIASAEVGLDAAPWAGRIAAAAAKKPANGLLIFASSSDHRLGFVDLPEATVLTTEIALSKIQPGATWVDGTSDFLVVTDDAIERVSFPSKTRRRVLGGIEGVFGLDVAPTGAVAILGSSHAHRYSSSLSLLQLGPAESTATPVTWSSLGDAYPRWSADGKRVALGKLRRPGKVAVVDSNTGGFEGGLTNQYFSGPAWHPSGEFLLMWVQNTDSSNAHCEMVVITPDRTRHARLGIVSEGRECPAIAVSLDGAHVASFVTSRGTQQLELFALGSSQPEVLSAYGSPEMLEWVPLQVADLGIEPAPPPPPEPEPPTPEPPKPEPSEPKPKPPKPKPPKPKPKTLIKPPPPEPAPASSASIGEVVKACGAQHPSSETSVTVRWWLEKETGKLSKVDVLSPSTPEALAHCIKSTARQLAPTPGWPASVTTERFDIREP